jgi:hypothetical protein
MRCLVYASICEYERLESATIPGYTRCKEIETNVTKITIHMGGINLAQVKTSWAGVCADPDLHKAPAVSRISSSFHLSV